MKRPAGQGTIWQQGGNWWIRWREGNVNGNGNGRRRRTEKFATRELAEAVLARITARLACARVGLPESETDVLVNVVPVSRSRRGAFGYIVSKGTTTHPSFAIRWREGTRHKQRSGFRTRTEAAEALARIADELLPKRGSAHEASAKGALWSFVNEMVNQQKEAIWIDSAVSSQARRILSTRGLLRP